MPWKSFLIMAWCTVPAVVSVVNFSCVPVTLVQSPRVVSSIAVSSTALYSATTYSLYENGKKTFSYHPNDSREFVIATGILPAPHLGIAKRVELSGYILPVLGEYIANYGIRAKVFLFETGTDRLFKNIAVAMCGGLNRLDGEWDEMEFHHAGLIFGTRMPVKKGELEFVFIPSYFNHASETHHGETPGIHLYEKGLDNSIGAIYWPFKQGLVQLNIGLTTRLAFSREATISWGGGAIEKHLSPFIMQGTIVFNLDQP